MDESQAFQPPPQQQQQHQQQQQQLPIEPPQKPEPVRSAPNSACVSCRKLKMKCERSGEYGAPCNRCAKSGRVCEDAVPTPRQRRRVADSPSRYPHPVAAQVLPLPGSYISSPNQYASPYPQQMAATAQMSVVAGAAANYPPHSLTHTAWTKPEFTLPLPSLSFLFHLECDMESFHPIGPGPHGDRSTVIFKGGRFEGPRLRGTIMAGGGDWEIVKDTREPEWDNECGEGEEGWRQTAYLDTRYNLQTHDGVVIYLRTTGTRTGRKRVLERLGDGGIGAEEYVMRLHLTFECGDERYSWLNHGVFVASSGRVGSQVIYDAYQLS